VDDKQSWRADRIRLALRGENPSVLRRLTHNFAVIGDAQFLPGYCVLLVDDSHVTRLSDMARPAPLSSSRRLRRWSGFRDPARQHLDRCWSRVVNVSPLSLEETDKSLSS